MLPFGMLLECEKCGAPLDAKGTERVVKCRYCGSRTQLQKLKTIAPQTPTGWKPPPVWTPPAHAPMPTAPLSYHAPKRFIAILFVAPAIIFFVGTAIALAFGNGGSLLGSEVDRWDRQSTLRCGFQERMLIEGVEAHVDGGPVVRADIECHLTIRNSRLYGPMIVAGRDNIHVTVENSTLEATERAIRVRHNVVVEVSGESRIHGGIAAIEAKSNPEVTVVGPATISSDGEAVLAAVNLNLTMRGGVIEGGTNGVRCRQSPELSISNARIFGGEHAMIFRGGASGELIDTEVGGPIEWGRHPSIVQESTQ